MAEKKGKKKNSVKAPARIIETKQELADRIAEMAGQLSDVAKENEALAKERDNALEKAKSAMTGKEKADKKARRRGRRISELQNSITELKEERDVANHRNDMYNSLLNQMRDALQKEKAEHEKTRQRVKTPPRFIIEPDAFQQLTKSAIGDDSNMSLMFGDAEITITSPDGKGKIPSSKIKSTLADRLSQFTSMATIAKFRGDNCLVCGKKDCHETHLIQLMTDGIDCPKDGPSEECNKCEISGCLLQGMPEKTGRVLKEKGSGRLGLLISPMSHMKDIEKMFEGADFERGSSGSVPFVTLEDVIRRFTRQ